MKYSWFHFRPPLIPPCKGEKIWSILLGVGAVYQPLPCKGGKFWSILPLDKGELEGVFL
ncbi:MAG: hypothetical protein LBQ59_04370 [Candidatus Peribacteria bacterium]|nr:hypothetical protein [Candidatus Peribacteria bacterium]